MGRLLYCVCACSGALAALGCGGADPAVLTLSGSAVGREAELLRRQLARFEAARAPLRVEIQTTPDAADDRHQLYVQWLNARVPDPDVLQLDVIWTSEFAAAGWILELDDFHPPVDRFFPATISANTWNGSRYALPWFVDVGMLYWRTDLMGRPPQTFDELLSLVSQAGRARPSESPPFGFVWQGARYEGLVTVFLEHLTSFGGRILNEAGMVIVDSEEGVRALTFMRDAIHEAGAVPPDVLAWQEEQVRFAFQNGQAVLMRNWPYAYRLLRDPAQSRVADRFGIAPMPAAADGFPAAALGGSALAINASTDRREAAFALVEYLTAPEQMLERAEVTGQLPARTALYDTEALERALGFDPADARRIIDRAVPRPATPVYSELSDILQVHLHRALTRQAEPRAALQAAATAMRQVLQTTGLQGSSLRKSQVSSLNSQVTPTSTNAILDGTVRVRASGRLTATRVQNTTDPEVCGRSQSLEDLVVSPRTRGIAHAIVAIEGVPVNRIPPTAPRRLAFDNRGCRFVPHAAVLITGSVVEILNSDPILHTVHLYGPMELNVSLPFKGMKVSRTLERSGMVVVKCDVHGWMQAFFRVDPHPFHAVTDADGGFRITGIPAGDYTVSVWHEKLGQQRRPVSMRGNVVTRTEFEYTLPTR